VLTLATLSPLSLVSAQRLSAPALNSAIPVRPAAEQLGFWTEAPSRREPALAGTLSFLIPFGTGSFYAGNAKHGLIHLSIGVGAAVLLVTSLCVDDCYNGEETREGVGFLLFVANWVAGTIVAVGDAKAFNRRHATAGSTVQPMDRLTGPAFSSPPTNGRFVVSLAHLSF
jgi:hypothetical protein